MLLKVWSKRWLVGAFLIFAVAGFTGTGCSSEGEELEQFCEEMRRIATTHQRDCDAMGQELKELTASNAGLVKKWESIDKMSDGERRVWEKAQTSCLNGLATINASCPDHPGVEDAFRALQ